MSCSEREDDFERRRQHLQELSDAELQAYFWELVGKIVAPLIEEARNHTTPAIERSVLLRMGFSSVEAKDLVEGLLERGLLGLDRSHARKSVDYSGSCIHMHAYITPSLTGHLRISGLSIPSTPSPLGGDPVGNPPHWCTSRSRLPRSVPRAPGWHNRQPCRSHQSG